MKKETAAWRRQVNRVSRVKGWREDM